MGPWVELLGTWYEIDEISKVVLIYDSPACDHGPNPHFSNASKYVEAPINYHMS